MRGAALTKHYFSLSLRPPARRALQQRSAIRRPSRALESTLTGFVPFGSVDGDFVSCIGFRCVNESECSMRFVASNQAASLVAGA